MTYAHLSFRYYHRSVQLNNFLGLLANEVVHRALSIVGDDVMHEPLEVQEDMSLLFDPMKCFH